MCAVTLAPGLGCHNHFLMLIMPACCTFLNHNSIHLNKVGDEGLAKIVEALKHSIELTSLE
jgi:hypothetical protein